MKVSELNHDNFSHFLGEYELLCMFDHPKIEKAFGIFMGNSDGRPRILLEFCQSNLETAVKNKVQSSVESVFSLYQIAKGMLNNLILYRITS